MKQINQLFGFNTSNFIGRQIVDFKDLTAIEWKNGHGKGYLTIQYLLNLSPRLNYDISSVKNTPTPETEFLAYLNTNANSDFKIEPLKNLEEHLNNIFNIKEKKLIHKSFIGFSLIEEETQYYSIHITYPEQHSVKKLNRINILLKNKNSINKILNELFNYIEILNLTTIQAINKLYDSELLKEEIRIGNKLNYQEENHKRQVSNSVYFQDKSPFFLGTDNPMTFGREIIISSNPKSNSEFVTLIKNKSVSELLNLDELSLFSNVTNFTFDSISSSLEENLKSYLQYREKNILDLESAILMINDSNINKNKFFSNNYKLNILQSELDSRVERIHTSNQSKISNINNNLMNLDESITDFIKRKSSTSTEISLLKSKQQLINRLIQKRTEATEYFSQHNIFSEEELSNEINLLEQKLNGYEKIKKDSSGESLKTDINQSNNTMKNISFKLDNLKKERKRIETELISIESGSISLLKSPTISNNLKNFIQKLGKGHESFNSYSEENIKNAEQIIKTIIDQNITLLLPNSDDEFKIQTKEELEYELQELTKEINTKEYDYIYQDNILKSLEKQLIELNSGENIDQKINQINFQKKKFNEYKSDFIEQDERIFQTADLNIEFVSLDYTLSHLSLEINKLDVIIKNIENHIDEFNENKIKLNKEKAVLETESLFKQLNKDSIEVLLNEQNEEFLNSFVPLEEREDILFEIEELSLIELSNIIDNLYSEIINEKRIIEDKFMRLINSSLENNLKKDLYNQHNVFQKFEAIQITKEILENELTTIKAERESNNISLYEKLETFFTNINNATDELKKILRSNSRDILNITTSAGNHYIIEDNDYINSYEESAVSFLKSLVNEFDKHEFDKELDKQNRHEIDEAILFFKKIAENKNYMYDFFLRKIKDFNLIINKNISTGNSMVLANEAKYSITKHNKIFKHILFCDEIANVDEDNAKLIVENAGNKALVFLGNQGFDVFNEFVQIKNISLENYEKKKDFPKRVPIYNKSFSHEELTKRVSHVI